MRECDASNHETALLQIKAELTSFDPDIVEDESISKVMLIIDNALGKRLRITGRDVHEAYRAIEKTSRPWEEITQKSKAHYEQMAVGLHAQFVTPLQGLVREWQALLKEYDELNADSFTEIKLWEESCVKLQDRTKRMMGEE
jgi:hypothetical protein